MVDQILWYFSCDIWCQQGSTAKKLKNSEFAKNSNSKKQKQNEINKVSQTITSLVINIQPKHAVLKTSETTPEYDQIREEKLYD